MATISFDFRVGSKVIDSYIQHSSLRRSLEYEIKESVKNHTLRRSLEYEIKESFSNFTLRRSLEYEIGGFLSKSILKRSLEYKLDTMPDFESNQTRLLQKVLQPISQVKVQNRKLIHVYNPRFKYIEEIRVGSKANRSVGIQPSFDMIFSNLGLFNQKINEEKDFTQKVDAVAQFNWTGTFDINDRFAPAYRVNNGPNIPIEKSLPITTFKSPTLRWSPTFNPESPEQYVRYIFQLSDNFTMKRLILEVETSSTSINLANYGISLEYNKRYYWRVKSKDYWNGKVLDESNFTNTIHFDIKEEIISSVPDILNPEISNGFWTNQFLLPPGQLSYIWNTSNLPPRDHLNNILYYEFLIFWYRFNSGLPGNPVIVESFPFEIKHTAANPPVFLEVLYDEQQHYMVFQMQINDSLGRKYQIKDFQYLNREDILNPDWINIDEHRIIGLKTNLNSTPATNNRGIITWDASFDADYPNYQELDYNLRFLKEPVNRNNDFYYALQVIDDNDLINLLDINSSDFKDYWNIHFDKKHIPRFIDHFTGLEYGIVDDFENKLEENEYEDIPYFPFPFQFVSKTIHFDLRYSYNIKYIEIEINNEMNIESGIDLNVILYNNGIEVGNYNYNRLPENVIRTGFDIEIDRVTLVFNSLKYPKLNKFKIMGNRLVGETLKQNDLIFVDTEKQDIVMRDFIINPDIYFNKTDLGMVLTPDIDSLQQYTFYGQNLKYRVLLFRDLGANELLYVKVTKSNNNQITLTNYELFFENITNIVLDFKNINYTFYELTYEDVEILENKIGDADYWIECRSRDYYRDEDGFKVPIQYSNWSSFASRKQSNIYTLKWNIKGLSINPTQSLYFRCKAILSSLNDETEIPIFGFKPQTNIPIKSLEVEKVTNEVLILQNENYKAELQQKINSIITDDSIIIDF